MAPGQTRGINRKANAMAPALSKRQTRGIDRRANAMARGGKGAGQLLPRKLAETPPS